METDYGKQMGSAIGAVLDMQSDCIRLLRDLDKALDPIRPLMGNLVTSGNGSSINSPQLYLTQYLFRLYAPVNANYRVLGLNLCFHDHPHRRFPEPIFVVANAEYDPAVPDRQEELQRAWDPWSAFFDWNSERTLGKALATSPRRGSIQKITVAAVPLYSINSLSAAIETIDLVGRPDEYIGEGLKELS